MEKKTGETGCKGGAQALFEGGRTQAIGYYPALATGPAARRFFARKER
jgi:hypothetical protein